MSVYDSSAHSNNLFSFVPKSGNQESLRYFLRITSRIYTEIGLSPGEYDFHNAILIAFSLSELGEWVSISDTELAKALGVTKGRLKINKKAIKRSRALTKERQSELGSAITINMEMVFDEQIKNRQYTYKVNIASVFEEVLENAPQGCSDWHEREVIKEAVEKFMGVKRMQIQSKGRKEPSSKEEFKRAATHLVKGMIKELSVGASIDVANSRWKYAIEEELKSVVAEVAIELKEKLCP